MHIHSQIHGIRFNVTNFNDGLLRANQLFLPFAIESKCKITVNSDRLTDYHVIDSPDFIVGSHTNPLWDRAILLQFFGQYALNSERLVGSLHNRNGFSLFIAILMDDDWDKFEWNREKSGPRNFYQPLWQLQVNERGCKNVCCRLVGSLRTKSIWQLRQWQTSCVLAAAMQCARFSFDSKWATWNVRTRRFVQICNRWMGYANYAIR